MRAKPNFTKKDFLVTLACVIFLLANIAAIGTSGRRRAKEIICFSNLHQWANIFQSFVNDNHGNFMQGWFVHNQTWFDVLKQYYGGQMGGITCCPEAVNPGTSMSGSTFEIWGYPTDDHGSYGSNAFIYNHPGTGEDWRKDYWRRPDVATADNIPMFLDSIWPTGAPLWTDTPPEYPGAEFWSGAFEGNMGLFCIPRHYGAINGLFMDFSARKIGLKELWLLKWARTYDLAQARANEPDWTIGTGWMVPLKDYDYIP